MQFVKKFPILILTVVLIAQLFAGCSQREQDSDSSSASEVTTSSQSSKEEGTEPEGDRVSSITPDYTQMVAEAYEHNDHTVGWLQVPGTNIDDSVVHVPDDKTNMYYYRLGYDRNHNFNGVFWADYSATFGDGTRKDLGVNTCIYGHAMTDVPEKESYDIKFGNLHEFRDEDFARKHPYINFSTEAEDMTFEIIGVFVANADNTSFQYNRNFESGKEFVEMVEKDVFPRSKYLYNVDLDENDKFLTLSACIYTLDNGTVTNYPDTYYRYAIMARLVDPDEPLKEEADFELNPDVLYDPDGKWPNQ